MCASLPFAGGATVVVPKLLESTESLDSPTESLDSPTESLDSPTESLDSPTENLDSPTENLDSPTENPDSLADSTIQRGGAPNIQPDSPLSQPTNEITRFLLIVLICMMISGPCVLGAVIGYFVCAGYCIKQFYFGPTGGGKTQKRRRRAKRFLSN
jgi:hypothetical protein